MKGSRRAVFLTALSIMFALTAAAETWNCSSCGSEGNTGNYCGNCGAVRPEQTAETWTCPECGNEGNTGNYCGDCGAIRPDQTAAYQYGGTVTLGTYAGEPIEWRMLGTREDGSYVLLSEFGLEAKRFNEDEGAVIWEDCSLRKWLNEDFLNSAFTDAEKALLVPVSNENTGNAKYGTAGGAPTEDTVWLLSIDEANEYFSGNDDRVCTAAETAKNSGVWTGENDVVIWWLRSPGSLDSNAATIGSRGRVNNAGTYASCDIMCVRPAVCAKLDS